MRSRWGIPVLLALVPLAGAGAAIAAPPGTGTISGTVTDQGGNRLPGICIGIADNQGSFAHGTTNTAGEYAIGNLPAGDSVTVSFQDCQHSDYVFQWYDGVTNAQDATQVVVPDGGTASGIDATMTPGVSFTGTVTDQSGAPLANVCVYAQTTDGGSNGSSQTDANGNYTIKNIAPGTHKVEFDPNCGGASSYAIQWYDGASSESQATALTGSAGQTFANIDAQLAPSNTPPPPAPAITDVSPNSGPTSGGSYVTITGTNFAPGATVHFGNAPADRAVQMNSTEIRAVTPSEAAGTVDITVTTDGGTSAVVPPDQFTYDPSQPAVVPSVTSISPASGPTSGGGWVTIHGQNLASANEVDFGDVRSPVVSSQFDNVELQARAPAHDAGVVDVTVKTDHLGTTAKTPADQYTYGATIAPVLPEAPLPLLIPVAGIGAAAIVVRRRRRRAVST